MNMLYAIVVIGCFTVVSCQPEVIMRERMYVPFQETNQFAVLSVSPANIPTNNPTKENINVEYYAHRYPGRYFPHNSNQNDAGHTRHSENWCFLELNTMWNYYKNQHNQHTNDIYLFTLNSPCHKFCTKAIINKKNEAPYNSHVAWHVGYVKLWHDTTVTDLNDLKNAGIHVYKLATRRQRQPRQINLHLFDLIECMDDFYSDICESSNPELLANFLKETKAVCGPDRGNECWANVTVPTDIGNNCNHTITTNHGNGYPLTTITISGDERLKACLLSLKFAV